MKNPRIYLETERLVLRPSSLSDALDIYNLRSDPSVAKYQGWRPKSIEEVSAQLEKENNLPFNKVNTWYRLILEVKTNANVIGEIGLHFVDEQNAQVEIGISLAPTFQHSGYAKEALNAVLDYLFHTLKKHRVYASIDPRNTSADALLRKLRFRKEAHFVKSYFHLGEWLDDVIYAQLKEEYQKPIV